MNRPKSAEATSMPIIDRTASGRNTGNARSLYLNPLKNRRAIWQSRSKSAKIAAYFFLNGEIRGEYTAPVNGHIKWKKTLHWWALFTKQSLARKLTAKLSKNAKNSKHPSPNFYCQSTSKNAKFDLFGITKCQLASLCYGSQITITMAIVCPQTKQTDRFIIPKLSSSLLC